MLSHFGSGSGADAKQNNRKTESVVDDDVMTSERGDAERGTSKFKIDTAQGDKALD